jgi:hypothetical protein
METWVIVIFLLALAGFFFAVAGRRFYSSFARQAREVRGWAGKQDEAPVSEEELKRLPEAVARYMRFSGVVGKKKISFMRLRHAGTFRPGAKRPFLPIRGEYYLTTKKPSFCWYGRISLLPGLTVAACDSYADGRGRMRVKAMSLFRIADARSPEVGMSGFGRCVAEMTLAPSFFLDGSRVAWTRSDAASADCLVSDSGLSTRARLFFHPDGALARIEVERFYDRGGGRGTIETFSGAGRDVRDFGGLTLASVVDGDWNLAEGDLHYVHFVIERVEWE